MEKIYPSYKQFQKNKNLTGKKVNIFHRKFMMQYLAY